MSARKLAIFVEGQTESIFIQKLLGEIAGNNRIVIVRKSLRNLTTVNIQPKNTGGVQFAILIVNCENDEVVKSRILENRENLIKAGYELVLGVRDLHPIPRTDIGKALMHLKTGVPTKGIPIEICLSVMEVESWFLFDETHYERIDQTLTIPTIVASFGFNPETDNPEDIDHPSLLLRDIYRLAGKTYNKSKKIVQRTVDVLDYSNLYMNGRGTLTYSGVLLEHLDDFLN